MAFIKKVTIILDSDIIDCFENNFRISLEFVSVLPLFIVLFCWIAYLSVTTTLSKEVFPYVIFNGVL